ncbi:MAG TPA: glucose-6-phosphate dehydrogenase assembly protein OpcA [Actinomycetes bacterium]|nr:glucose-6-phosphate dehydrogenase assembly protein OpcA [Actinomycetes bacterium]
MSQSAQTAEAFEEVAPGEIELALERQRSQGDGTVIRASVANLVVVTPNRAAGQRALAAVEELGSRAPSRCVVLIAEPPEGRQGVRSWARVVNRRPASGPELVWEEVVVQTNVHPRHLTAVVLPLLLPDLPVFTWWEGTPPFGEEVFAELTSVTDRLIVDSAAFGDPTGDLRRLAGAIGSLAPAVTDCAWGRLTPWRELLAAPFSAPGLRPALDRIHWLRVDSVEPTAGQELVGWLASRLGWELEAVHQAGDELGADYRTPAGSCQVRVVAGIGSSNLTRVHLEMETDDGPASVRVEAPPGHLVATVEVPGQPTGRRKVGRSPGPSSGPGGLGAELQLFGRDRVFEDALAEAAGLVPE